MRTQAWALIALAAATAGAVVASLRGQGTRGPQAETLAAVTELRSITDDLTDRVDAIAAGGYEHVDTESNVRTFVPAETIDALRHLGAVRLPHRQPGHS